jgi:hypothetical protein
MLISSNKHIRIFCTTDPDLISTAELANWSGKLYHLWRSQIDVSPPELARPGVYILFGRDDAGRPAVYVGEGDNVYRRVRQQVAMDFIWEDAVIFISHDSHFTSASSKYLEHLLYWHCRKAGIYHVINANVPEKPKLSRAEQLDLEASLAIIIDLNPRFTKHAF